MALRLRALGALGLSAVLLAGCSLVPDFTRPDPPVPTAWPTGAAYGNATPASASAVPADAIGWRDFFRDPGLHRLIEIALANNRDLRVSVLNVEAASAAYRAQRGEIFPQAGATGSMDYTRTPGDVAGTTDGKARVSRTFSTGVGFTAWEIDLFGRLRSLSEAAFEQYLSSEETRRAAQISLVAQVASGYLAIIADRELLDLTRRTLASQEDSWRLTQSAAQGGTATALTLAQARTAVETARANLAQYTRQLAQDENALALLLGQPVPADLPPASLASDLLLADLPAGLPSELLTRRPDVLAAEHDLRAANADIGAARAAFFPSITLTSSYGTAGADLSRLFAGGSSTWNFAPQINIPIFTGGINQANLDAAKVRNRIQVANYERSIQTAFREISDSLAARGTYGSQIEAQQAVTAAYAESYRLSELRFRNGVDSYLVTLDSQRELYAAQQTLIGLRRDRLTNLVTLYKVLGGGWTDRTGQTAQASPPRKP